MRPANWYPPIELSPVEEKVVSRIKPAKLFTFVRHNRHQIFDDGFEQELALALQRQQCGSKARLSSTTGVRDDSASEPRVFPMMK